MSVIVLRVASRMIFNYMKVKKVNVDTKDKKTNQTMLEEKYVNTYLPISKTNNVISIQ